MNRPRHCRAVALVLALACAPRLALAQSEYEGPSIECSAPLDSDPKTLTDRAREHYERASQLFEEGQYEAAITEFTAVYCLIGLDNAAYSIALSYVNLVDYEHALLWFQLYVRVTQNAGKRNLAANRIDRIRKLPARVSVSTQPPHASVALVNDEGTISGRADAKEPLRVPAGAYTLRVTMDGFEPVEQAIDVRIGQPYTYSFRLTELKGALRVTTNPPSSRIFVDDKLVAVGTYTGDLPIGRHKVAVEAEGRKPRTQDVEVDAKDTATLFVSLPPPPRSGRWELLSAMTVLGASSGGLLGSTVFKQGDAGSTIITVGAGAVAFAGGYFGVSENIPVGHTSWLIGGTLWGTAEGAAVAALFTKDKRVISSAAVAGLITGAVASALSVKRFDPSNGDAAFINSGGLWGGVSGLILYALFREDQDTVEESKIAPFALAGLNTGLLAGAALAYRYEYSRGHIALIDLSGLAGAVTGVALSSPFEDSAAGGVDDTQLHFALIGMTVGLVTGGLLTRKMDVDEIPASVSAAVPDLSVTRTLAGETIPTLGWSGVW